MTEELNQPIARQEVCQTMFATFRRLFLVALAAAGLPATASADFPLIKQDHFTLTGQIYSRTDIISLSNTVDLDTSNKDDASTYLGIDYYFGLDLQFGDDGPQAYLKLQRNGPYGYDAPVFIHNALRTSIGPLERYNEEELLPEVRELWVEAPLGTSSVKIKGGRFGYSVGHGVAIGTAYENYGLGVTGGKEGEGEVQWRFHYFYPDAANNSPWGPRVPQQADQLVDYEQGNTHLVALDAQWGTEKNRLQPYLGFLYDRTADKRSSVFAAPTHNDLLGTAGASWDATAGHWSVQLEGAHNFGRAESSDSEFKDVEHSGYLIYSGLTYDAGKTKPHARFILASGNKVTTEMVDNGDTALVSGKNRAFSTYSPFNTNLFDAVSEPLTVGPIVALGLGWGLNYGIDRPTTFGDAGILENLILPGVGFEHQCTDRLTMSWDWWYLQSFEPGIGTFDGASKELSPELGQEVDLVLTYSVNEHAELGFSGGYFMPGNFYREERDDTGGSLLTPFIRGDGDADPAYQLELSLTLRL